MKIGKFRIGLVVLATTVNSCHIADLRTKDIKNGTQTQNEITKGRDLLNETILAQGMTNLDRFSTYEVTLTDSWKGVMGKMGNPWDWNKDQMKLRYSLGDFDGQVEVVAGEEKGFLAGIQSWNYYEKVDGELKTIEKEDRDKVFTLAAYHYFFELSIRLIDAPFIRYAGDGMIGDTKVEKVFVSWSNSRTRTHDQFLLFINKSTKLIDAVQFTTRDSSLPGSNYITGSLKFEDYKNIQGVLIPFKQSGQIGEPKSSSKFLHQVVIQEFHWDSFPVSDLRPFSNIESIGDSKPNE